MASTFVPFTPEDPKTSAPVEAPPGTEHKAPSLTDGDVRTYSQIKSAFDEVTAHKKANTRFSLSELVSSHLSLEEEERLRFEKKVTEAVGSELDKIKETAREEARKEGFEAGRKAAYDEEKLRLAKVIEGLAELLNSMETAKLELSSHYEEELLKVAFRMARIIVHREIAERPEIIVSSIQEILGRISKDDDITIRLGVHEAGALEMVKQELEKVARNGRIHFEFNDNLSKGDCVVDSLSGEIASYIDLKFKKLSRSIFNKDLPEEPVDNPKEEASGPAGEVVPSAIAQAEVQESAAVENVEAPEPEAKSTESSASEAEDTDSKPETEDKKPEGDGSSGGDSEGAQGTGT